MKNFFGVLSTLLLLCSSISVFAAQSLGLGEVAQNLMEPVGLMSDFVQSACFVIGAAFLFATIIKYVEHRRSPLMVPISTVVFLLIAGIILILLPFLSFFVEGGVILSLFNKSS